MGVLFRCQNILPNEVVIVAARLTDKQKKLILADYVELESYNAVAKKHKVSVDTVRRTVLKSEETVKNAIEKKEEENTADILSHMESKKDKVNQIIDKYLDRLLDDEILYKATPSQLTTALGTLIDKFTNAETKGASKEGNNLADAIAKSVKALGEKK